MQGCGNRYARLRDLPAWPLQETYTSVSDQLEMSQISNEQFLVFLLHHWQSLLQLLRTHGEQVTGVATLVISGGLEVLAVFPRNKP